MAAAYLVAREHVGNWLEETYSDEILLEKDWNQDSSADEEESVSLYSRSNSRFSEDLMASSNNTFEMPTQTQSRHRYRSARLNKIILRCLKKEMDFYDIEAKRYLSALARHRPWILAAVKSEQLSAAILHCQSEQLEELFREGLLLEKEYLDLLQPITGALAHVHRGPQTIREARNLHVTLDNDTG